jgi:hypothetical protein
MIRVYHFRLWDDGLNGFFVPPYKKPADGISDLGGVMLAETAETVELSSLDDDQRYDPREHRRRVLT